MSIFNKFKRTGIKWVTLPQPDDSIQFFQIIKEESEKYWTETSPNNDIYGFQIQQGTKWRQGLKEDDLKEFEKTMGFSFPTPLRDYYKTMNGLTKKGVNVYGKDGTTYSYRSVFYSYPDDVILIKEYIKWIYEATSVKEDELKNAGISRIFPIYGHRFMLIDVPGNPILSMYGDDIIYWTDNLSKLLANEIFDNIYNIYDFESSPQSQPEINFWLSLE